MAIRAYFRAGETDITINGLHQWDTDQTLIINDYTLPSDVEIHFACPGMETAKCESCSSVAGCISAAIPDECLQNPTAITAWVCANTSSGSQTLRTIVMPIIPRTKPGDVGPSTATVTDKIVGLSMASGDQVVQAETGTTMDRVTITKPATLKPENIKENVNIGGVVGTFKPEQVTADLRERSMSVLSNGSYTVYPTDGSDGMSKLNLNVKVPEILVDAKLQEKTVVMNGEYTADSGYDGLSKVIVEIPTDRPVNNQNKNVEPTTERQSITADTGFDGLGTVTVEAVTRDIDDNIKPSNIKKDVTILGVTGTFDAGSVEFKTQDKTVTPTIETQDIFADEGFDGLSSVTVKAVTSAIDENIKAENIKAGVSILGVDGTIEFTKQAKTAAPTTSQQTITPDVDFDGLSSVTIEAVTSSIDTNIKSENIKSGIEILGITGSYEFVKQSKTVTATTEQQTITADSSYDGLESVTVEAVTAVIDSDITAGNIKKGVNILGVDGSLEYKSQTVTITPTKKQQNFIPDLGYDGFNAVTVSAVTSEIDSNITAENIKSGETILGVAGTCPTFYTVSSTAEMEALDVPAGTLAIIVE